MPPQHRVDHEPVYIHVSDPAWDFDRINREREEEEAGWESRKEEQGEAFEEPDPVHPVSQYYAGAGRYDLHATYPWKGEHHAPHEYIKPDAKPVRYVLRRLNIRQVARVTDMLLGDGQAVISDQCVRWGLVRIEGSSTEVLEVGQEVSEETLRELYDSGGMPLLEWIGRAVWRVSQPLTDAEKKRSAS